MRRPTVSIACLTVLVAASFSVAAEPASQSNPAAPRAELDSDRSILESFEAQNRASAAALLAEVEYALRQARTRMVQDPAAAQQDLQLLSERLAKAPQLTTVARANVRARIATAMREAQRRAATKSSDDGERQAREAETGARLRLEDDTTRRQERVKQLTARYQALLDEGRDEEARRLAETALRATAPDSPVSHSAPLVAGAIANRATEKAVRDAKTDALFQYYTSEQKAAIPGSDEEPMIYPDAAVWKKLTARRLAHTAVDDRQLSPAQERIYKALKETTTIDFLETPLSDVVTYLKDLHGIEIQLDGKELAQVAIDSDLPVSAQIKGIPLRSALRSMLGQLDLAYIVVDDAVLITTPEKARRAVDRRIYPVGDIIFSRRPMVLFGQ